MVPFLNDLEWPLTRISRLRHFFRSQISGKRRVLKTKLLLHTNRKLYLAYGMVLCLVTFADLWRRRAGLSASAELLVRLVFAHNSHAMAKLGGMPNKINKHHTTIEKKSKQQLKFGNIRQKPITVMSSCHGHGTSK